MSKKITLKTDASLDGRRIEYVLKTHLGISSSQINRLKRNEKGILLNGNRAKVIERVKEGDSLEINIEGKEAKNVTPSHIPLDIIFEDSEMIVVNKTRSMPVHPSRTHCDDSLLNAVMYHTGGEKAFHIITRLDKDTSGVVLIAKNPISAAKLTEDIKCGRIKKEYVAVINGELEMAKGTITAPIKKAEGRGIKRCISEDGKEALTEYELIDSRDGFSFVRLYPITGRTHQLRVHMSYLGHPIFGDNMYGAPQKNEKTRLHCKKIVFNHPDSGERIEAEAQMPTDMTCF